MGQWTPSAPASSSDGIVTPCHWPPALAFAWLVPPPQSHSRSPVVPGGLPDSPTASAPAPVTLCPFIPLHSLRGLYPDRNSALYLFTVLPIHSLPQPEWSASWERGPVLPAAAVSSWPQTGTRKMLGKCGNPAAGVICL